MIFILDIVRYCCADFASRKVADNYRGLKRKVAQTFTRK